LMLYKSKHTSLFKSYFLCLAYCLGHNTIIIYIAWFLPWYSENSAMFPIVTWIVSHWWLLVVEFTIFKELKATQFI
jgi:hypothetical protein